MLFCLLAVAVFDMVIFPQSRNATTILPVFTVAQIVFFIPFLFCPIPKWVKLFLLIVLISSIVYIVYSQSRAAWLGLLTGVMVVVWIRGYFNNRKLFWLSCTVLAVAVFALTFFIKTGSSNGRLLIYKVMAYNLSAGDLLTGIGPGKFKAEYNLWQARYFEHHDINSPEALLADNTFFAFNDYGQLVIETGIIGILLLLIAFSCFLLLLRKLKSTSNAGRLATGAAASIIAIVTAALFSYPFQNPWIVVYVISCLAVLLFSTVQHRVLKYSFTGMAFSAVILFSWRALALQKQERQKNKAITLSQTGHKRECMQMLGKMIRNGCKDGHVFYLYAKELYMAGQPDSALFYLKHSTRYINFLESCRLFAGIYEEQGDMINAERHYLRAVYMAPNRFESRFELVQFYTKYEHNDKAKYWACSILKLPVKIPSPRVSRIKAAADSLCTNVIQAPAPYIRQGIYDSGMIRCLNSIRYVCE